MNELLATPPSYKGSIECIESWHDDKGNWYRIYSDGWCEQGGFSAGDNWRTITLHKEYVDTNYAVQLTNFATSRTGDETCHLRSNSKTVSNFIASAWGSTSSGDGIIWEAKGYIS